MAGDLLSGLIDGLGGENGSATLELKRRRAMEKWLEGLTASESGSPSAGSGLLVISLTTAAVSEMEARKAAGE